MTQLAANVMDRTKVRSVRSEKQNWYIIQRKKRLAGDGVIRQPTPSSSIPKGLKIGDTINMKMRKRSHRDEGRRRAVHICQHFNSDKECTFKYYFSIKPIAVSQCTNQALSEKNKLKDSSKITLNVLRPPPIEVQSKVLDCIQAKKIHQKYMQCKHQIHSTSCFALHQTLQACIICSQTQSVKSIQKQVESEFLSFWGNYRKARQHSLQLGVSIIFKKKQKRRDINYNCQWINVIITYVDLQR